MDKSEVAEFLGVSLRTVERYVLSGKLKVVYVRNKGYYDEEEVSALREDLNQPVHRAIVDMGDSSLAEINTQLGANLLAFLVSKLQEQVDEFAYLETLERCAKHNWCLPSPQIKSLIKLKKLPKSPFFRYGFVFTRQGRWWRINKIETTC